MSTRKNFISAVKSVSETGLLFRIRTLLVHLATFVLNLDFLVKFVLRKKPALDKQKSSVRIGVLANYRPIFWHGSIFEMQLAKLSEARGAIPTFIHCGGAPEVCDVQFYRSNKETNPTLCQNCKIRNKAFAAANDVNSMVIDDFIDATTLQPDLDRVNAISTIAEASAFVHDQIPMGTYARLSTARYFLRMTLEQQHLDVFKKYLRSLIRIHNGFSRLLQQNHFDSFLVFNGLYSTFRVPLDLMQRHGIKVSTYEMSEQERFLFTTGDIALLWNDVTPKFQDWLSFTQDVPDLSAKVDDFIEQRRKNLVSSYVDLNQTFDTDQIDIAAFTNIVWDSAAYERDYVFKSQFHWVQELVSFAFKNPQYKIALRVHPAETNVTYNKTTERMADFIHAQFKDLPPNLLLIPPQERRNSYGLVKNAKAIAVYTSSIGLEATLMGKPVIIAGFAHYNRPGITVNPKDPKEYFELLERAIAGDRSLLPNDELVRKYIWWFYKLHHRLINTNLHSTPFLKFEDSRFLRVPKIIPSASPEMAEIVSEFLAGGSPQA
jgi:hypothetical protein